MLIKSVWMLFMLVLDPWAYYNLDVLPLGPGRSWYLFLDTLFTSGKSTKKSITLQ